MNVKEVKLVFTKKFYQRKKDEPVSSFLLRSVFGMTICFVVIGLPFMAILADAQGKPPVQYILHHALPAYVGAIIGGPIGLLIRENRQARKKENQT